jgi:glycine hydroxymethyltransferase
MCDEIHITLNKNTILGDQSAVTPGGVRIGTPAVTTRGYVEADMKQVANFLDEAAKLSIDIQKSCGSKKLQDFLTAIPKDARVKQLGNTVQDFSMQFDIPGFDASKIEKF